MKRPYCLPSLEHCPHGFESRHGCLSLFSVCVGLRRSRSMGWAVPLSKECYQMSKIFVILQVMSGLEQAGGPNRQRLNNNIKKIKKREKKWRFSKRWATRHSVGKLLRKLNRRSACVLAEKIHYRAWNLSISEDTPFLKGVIYFLFFYLTTPSVVRRVQSKQLCFLRTRSDYRRQRSQKHYWLGELAG